MKRLSALLLLDFYKVSHRVQYPENTQTVYSTWTPRGSRMKGVDKVVAFGAQYFIKNILMNYFNEHFFQRPLKDVLTEYSRVISSTLGDPKPETAHIEELHKLGYLPLLIKSVAEGTLIPLRVPMLTIENTDPRFFWLTNYIETIASAEMWQPSTSATIAYEFRKTLDKHAMETVGSTAGVEFQGHDFSMRGMSSLSSAMSSGAGHLLSFVGTDTVPAIMFAEEYYGANVEKELVGTSIPATEHSVMCANGSVTVEQELSTYRRLITQLYPKGFVSIVSDTRDLFSVLTEILPVLKKDILARDGRVVIRPDSGDPVKIIVGDADGKTEAERKGAIEVLWDLFGGTTTAKGYKLLDTHIGLIYGDAISLERAEAISAGLKAKGFASTNAVYGIGSYTYQLNTRDTFGFALKSTYCVINGDEKMIFKDPKTDDGLKKSQLGRVVVYQEEGVIKYKDGLLAKDVLECDLLRPIFLNGKLLIDQTFSEIRAKLASQK